MTIFMKQVVVVITTLLISALAFLCFCEACSPGEIQAIDNTAASAAPYINGFCAVAEVATDVVDPPAAGAVDWLCTTVESADKHVAAQAALGVTSQIVRSEKTPTVDGGPTRIVLRVRCRAMFFKPADAGGGR